MIDEKEEEEREEEEEEQGEEEDEGEEEEGEEEEKEAVSDGRAQYVDVFVLRRRREGKSILDGPRLVDSKELLRLTNGRT